MFAFLSSLPPEVRLLFWGFIPTPVIVNLVAASLPWRRMLADTCAARYVDWWREYVVQASTVWDDESRRLFQNEHGLQLWNNLVSLSGGAGHMHFAAWYVLLSQLVRSFNFELVAVGLPLCRMPRRRAAFLLAWRLWQSPPASRENFAVAFADVVHMRLSAHAHAEVPPPIVAHRPSRRHAVQGLPQPLLRDVATAFMEGLLRSQAHLILGGPPASPRSQALVEQAMQDLAELAALPFAFQYSASHDDLIADMSLTSETESESFGDA